MGENFEGLVTFKTFCDEKDKFYVYKINDSRGNRDQPSFVFKTSESKLRIADSMIKDGDSYLNVEYCFFDGKHKRCRDFVTLTASVYNPLLRKQIPLAIMDTESENTECVTLFWNIFQEALRKCLGKEDATFNPIGWCTDMAGENMHGIKDVFGNEALSRIKSCEFHCKKNVNEKARLLRGEIADEFTGKCEGLLLAQTVGGYNKAMESLQDFIKASPIDRKFLKTWLKWWDNRKELYFELSRL